MECDEKKQPRLHIHLGGVIILIILALILFKVDIKNKIESPQFQKNITYISDKAKEFWGNITNPLKEKIGNSFIDITNKQLEKIQEDVTENVLKIKETKSFNYYE